MRIVLSYARKLRIPSVIVGIVLALFLGVSAPALAASPAHAASSSSAGRFEYHLIKQGAPTLIYGGAKSSSATAPHSITPYYAIIDCLNLWMNLSNPQLDVVRVYVQVQNWCGTTVTNLHLTWDTGGKCNGRQFIGPSGGFTLASLGNQDGAGQFTEWSTICWSNSIPPFPVNFTMAGYDDANAFISVGYRAEGHYDTQTYTFL